jgi:pentose-5-phosphate-3-epimerase
MLAQQIAEIGRIVDCHLLVPPAEEWCKHFDAAGGGGAVMLKAAARDEAQHCTVNGAGMDEALERFLIPE